MAPCPTHFQTMLPTPGLYAPPHLFQHHKLILSRRAAVNFIFVPAIEGGGVVWVRLCLHAPCTQETLPRMGFTPSY